MKRPNFIGFCVFVIVMLIASWITYGRYRYYKELEHNTLLQIAFSTTNNIESHLNNARTQCKTLSFIVENYGEPKDFNKTAEQLLGKNSILSAIELTDSGRIEKVYPYETNKAVIGYDILKDKSRNLEALKALEQRDFYFSGPFALKQGGFGIVGRMPIFKDSVFIGFSAVVINFDTLLKAAQIDKTGKGLFQFQIEKISAYTGEKETYITNTADFNTENFVSVDMPIGDWKFNVAEKEPINIFTFSSTIFLGLLLAIISGFFARYITYIPQKLSKMVDKKTAELKVKQEELLNTLEQVNKQNKKLKELRWMQSHIIRAPLARLLGLTQLLLESEHINEENQLTVKYINQTAEEFDKIIKNASEEIETPSI